LSNPSDLDLLRLEIKTLWISDERGRLLRTNEPAARAAPFLVIAGAQGGRALALGADVPDALAVELRAAVARAEPSHDPRDRPRVLERCRHLLEAGLSPVRIACGPTYVMPGSVAYASEVHIHRSDCDVESLRDKRPVSAWAAEECDGLLNGCVGPFAIATVDDQVVSVCHTSRMGAGAAEAGVWTDPALRGNGHASAVTAAWASLFDRTLFTLFYSTSGDNVASQRVAAKLGLREIGWLWSLRP
jgi:hypothetical protein